jgi:hypothetical protein
MSTRKWTGLLAGLALAACASTGSGVSGSSGPRSDPNLITASELAGANATNVYDAIQLLRPAMLRPRLAAAASSISAGQTGNDQYVVHVYVDQTLLGDLSALHNVSLATVHEIRYLDPSQAMQRFGSGNPAGVILLLTR